ncbi:MAG: hypothetical protein K2M00_08305 [Muribaculaceae bacterium]|nr:hypothetical protein [Muribaculaceae bacterium]
MRRVIIVMLLFSTAAVAQNMRRPTPRAGRRAAPVSAPVELSRDTVVSPMTDSISIAGFEKPLRAMKETMFITNNTGEPVIDVGLDMVYTDLKGRMLHRATHNVEAAIPAGETRRVELRSFDTSGLFYYRLSPVPARAANATPFDVKVTVTYITHPRLNDSQ